MPPLLDIPPYGGELLGDLEESMICMQDNMNNDLSVAIRLSLLLVEDQRLSLSLLGSRLGVLFFVPSAGANRCQVGSWCFLFSLRHQNLNIIRMNFKDENWIFVPEDGE